MHKFFYLSISDKEHKALNMQLNGTVLTVDICIIKTQVYMPSHKRLQ